MLKNAKEFGKVYYGLHFYPGVAEYREPDKDPYRVFIGEETIKNMGPTFSGKPVYVRHVDEVNMATLQEDADGWVMESFFNKADGKHWVKFLVVSDKGHQAVRNGWKLSNAYVPKSMGVGGLCNGVEYQKEVTSGEYEHLAIVDNPRYEESVILTPEEFKEYNQKKEAELQKLSNSKDEKGESKMGLSFWKKSKVENSADFESTTVQLPKSKVEMTISQLVTEMDAIQNMQGYANEDHMVKAGEDEMTVKDMVKKYNKMMDEKKEAEDCMNDEEMEEGEGKKKKENDDDPDAGFDPGAKKNKKKNEEKSEPEMKNKKKNDEKPEPDLENKKKNSAEDEKKKKENFDSINNAADLAKKASATVDLSFDRTARGKVRYGS